MPADGVRRGIPPTHIRARANRFAPAAAIALATAWALAAPASAQAQRCDKKNLAPREMLAGFDYSEQSVYTQMGTGDTIRMKTVLYTNHKYRIFVAGERRLEDLGYRIYYPEKRFEPVAAEVIDKEIPLYRRDQNGMLVYGENQEPIPEGTTTVKDTVWTRRLATTETLLFDSQTANGEAWESVAPKTRLMIIEITVPANKRYFFGCVALMVGRLPIDSDEYCIDNDSRGNSTP